MREKRSKKSHRIDIRLTSEEYEKAQQMAEENNLTISELFRAKTLKKRLPQRVTKIAGLTYWELGKISNDLNQIAKAVNTSEPMAEPVVVDLALLEQVINLVKQVRREITGVNSVQYSQDDEE
jgi:hypothetical protein